MKRIKVLTLLTLSILSAGLIVNPSFVNATQAECTSAGVGSLCFYKDVALNAPTLTWNSTEVTATQGQKVVFQLYLYNWTNIARPNLVVKDVLPSGLQLNPADFRVRYNNVVQAGLNVNDLFAAGGLNLGTWDGYETITVVYSATVVGPLNPGPNTFSGTGSATADGGISKSDGASVNVSGGIGELVINEVNWAGSTTAANDDWIEFYNRGTSSVNLTNYSIQIGSTNIPLSGTVAGNSYFLLSHYAAASSNIDTTSDQVSTSLDISSGQNIALRFNSTTIDQLNTNFAGYNQFMYRSASRISQTASGNDINNWFTSENSANLDNTTHHNGTPKADNFSNQIVSQAESHVMNAGNGSLQTAANGQSYAMTNGNVSGQYLLRTLSLSNGNYRINFIASTNNNGGTGKVARFGVQSASIDYGRDILPNNFRASGDANWENISFEFKVTGGSASWYVNGGGTTNRVLVDKVIITRIPNSGSQIYEAEDNIVNPYNSVQSRQSDGVTISAGNSGYFTFGPYAISQNQGDWYRATFRLKVNYPGGTPISTPVGQVDIGDKGVGTVKRISLNIADFPASDTYYDFVIRFNRPSSKAIEYRFLSTGQFALTADKVTVDSIGAVSPITYQAEDYLDEVGGQNLFDATAQGNEVRRATANNVSFFRQRVYGEQIDGQLYKATFRLRAASNSSNSRIGRIGISNILGKGYLSWREVVGSEFNAANSFQDFTLYYRHTITGSMEFFAQSYGVTDFQIDSVTIEPTTDPITYHLDSFKQEVGSWAYDASAPYQQAHVKSGAGNGYSSYGPYLNDLQANQYYNATFNLKTSNNSNTNQIAMIDVLNATDNVLLARRYLRGPHFSAANTWQQFSLNFRAPASNKTIEYRTYYYNQGQTLSTGAVTVSQSSVPTTWTYEAEDLQHQANTGSVVNDGGTVGFQSSEASNVSGYSVYGPNTTDQTTGNYRATFYMKVSDNSDPSNAIRIDALNSGGSGVYAYRHVKGTDFSNNTNYQAFSVDFTRTSNGTMQYRVLWHDILDVTVDRIVIEKL